MSLITIDRVVRQAGATRTKLPRLPDDEREKLFRDYLAGCDLEELARRHNVQPSTVKSFLSANGIRRQPMMKPEEIAKAADMHGHGMTATAIGQLLGYSQTCISRKLRDLGLVFSNRHRPKGGRITTPDGYVKVLLEKGDPLNGHAMSGGYILEHRLVMARHLGRPLRSDETVHHVNGIKSDNRLENLQLRTGRHGKGERFCCGDCGSVNLVPLPV